MTEPEEEALELDLDEEAGRPRLRVRHLLYVFVVSFVAVMLGVVLLFVYFAKSSADSRAATCAVVEASRKEKRAQLLQYQENPPTTELARSLQETYRDSLRSWDSLWSTLGCKEAPAPTP